METLNFFLLVAAAAFLFIGIIWTSRGWENALMKMFFIGLSIWGLFVFGIFNGYLVIP